MAGRESEDVALVLRAQGLGDLLVAVPALRALRRALPEHRMVLATPGSLGPVVDVIGCVDDLLPTDEPAALHWTGAVPDVVVNLHGTGPQSHRALDATVPGRRIGFRAPGWNGPEWGPIAARHPHERERWCALLERYGIPADPDDLRLEPPGPTGAGTDRAPVLVHPGAGFGSKCWPAPRFGELAAALDRHGRPVLVTGSPAERELAAAVARAAGLGEDRVLAGATGLAELCRLVAGAALVVSGDTGIAHLAYAFGTPSVTLFGPVGPAQWGPPARGPHLALGDAAARRGEPFAADPDPALLAVGVSDVLDAAAAAVARGRSTT